MKLSRTSKILVAIVSMCIVFSISYFFASNKTTVEKMTTGNAMTKYIDVVYYINLDHREDRKTGFIEEMAKMDYPEDKIIRISGIYKKGQGSLGCSMSHVKAMEAFIESGHNTCIIFEDDFVFSENPEQVNKSINELFESGIAYDVCMLACWEHEVKSVPDYNFVKKVNKGLTTSAYIVTKDFANVLLENFKEGCDILEQKFKENREYASEYKYEIDQYWTLIQPQNNWYVFNPRLGKQRDTYSDVREREKIKEYDF